jgi:hypothetical protein
LLHRRGQKATSLANRGGIPIAGQLEIILTYSRIGAPISHIASRFANKHGRRIAWLRRHRRRLRALGPRSPLRPRRHQCVRRDRRRPSVACSGDRDYTGGVSDVRCILFCFIGNERRREMQSARVEVEKESSACIRYISSVHNLRLIADITYSAKVWFPKAQSDHELVFWFRQ